MNLAKEQNKTDCLFLQETLETLEDVLTEGIFRSTPDRGILFANSAIINMFGYQSLEELKSVSNNLLYADEEARKYLIGKLAAEGSLQNHRVLYRRKDHSNFWGSLTCKQVVRNGGVCYEGVVTDITETIRQEKQIQEKQDALEKLTMEMDRFIYSASHDIRSPISSIQGLINIMKLELKDANSKNLVELMAVSVNRLERFVNGLTAFARNAKKEINDNCIDFDKVITFTLEKLMHHPSFSKVIVTNEISRANTFYSDMFRVRLILNNVIKNAFDFCDQNKSNRAISIQITTLSEKSHHRNF